MSTKYCLPLFFTVFLSLAASYGDSNVLINPGFEDGITGWTDRNCSIDTVGDPVYSGSLSGRAYNRTATWQGIKQSMLDKMEPGETYKISGYVRLEEGASPDNVGITVQQNDSNGTQYIPVSWSTAYDDSWTHLFGEFTLNVTGMLTSLDVYFEGPADEVAFYVDDANVDGPEAIPPPPPDPNATGEVDVRTRHQEIEGFGASGSWFENWLTAHPQKNEIYDVLFGQLGLDIYRLRNNHEQSGAAEYMSNSAEIITEGQSSLGRPLKVMMSSWSPPDYLKSNNSTVGGTLKKDGDEYCYVEFAQWWADSLAEWSSYGIDVDYLNIQNEPDYEATWDSCVFSYNETIDWAGYNLAFEAVYNELNSQMGSNMPKMLAADAAGIPNSYGYLDNLIDGSHVYGYAHHLYNIGSGGNPDAYIYAMENFASQYGDKPLLQTEFSHNTETFTDAMNLAVLMHNSLAVEGVSAYLYWDLYWGYYGWGYSGLVSIDNPWVTDPNYPPPSYTINPVYYAFKHYSAFIHSGWKRVEALCDNPHLRMSAYISPDNKQLSVVLINTTTDTDIELDLSIDNSSVLYSDVYRTSHTENCVLLDDLAPCSLQKNQTEKFVFLNGFEPGNPLLLPASTITTLALSTTGIHPLAVAGPNQVAYATIDGYVDVSLDGSGSYDDDGDPLSYYWYWTIDGNDYEATGISPTIQLPVGEHQIKLIVNDGLNDSRPDSCIVNVIEPLEAKLFCTPTVLYKRSCCGFIIATIKMPKDVNPSDINEEESLLFFPGGVEEKCHYIFQWPRWRHRCTYITAFFDKSDCIDNLSPGLNKISIVGKLTSGRYYYATGYIKLVPARWWWWRWPLFFHRDCKPSCWKRY